MTKLELKTHPSIEAIKNTKTNFEIVFKLTSSLISRNSLLEFLQNEIDSDIEKIDDFHFIFDKPLILDNKKKIWFKINNGVIDILQNNIKDAKTSFEVEEEYAENEMAIGIEIDAFSMNNNYDDEISYSWCLLHEDGSLKVSARLPNERENMSSILFYIDNYNAISKNKIIGFDAIIG